MATTFILPDSAALRWPPVCVHCGAPDTQPQKVFGYSVDDFRVLPFLIRVTDNRLTLHYPLCRKHQVLRRAAQVLLALATLAVTTSLVVLYELLGDAAVWWLATIAAVVTVFVFVFARFAEPVRVFGISDGLFRLQIRNDIYARAFATANALDFQGLQREPHVLAPVDSGGLPYRVGRIIGGLFARRR